MLEQQHHSAAAERGRLLVVEDDDQVRKTYVRALKADGWSVESAEDGTTALEKFSAGAFDAVLSDITMPSMDGVTLLKALRAKDLDLPVVLITAGPTIKSAIEAVELGAFRYLTKPVTLEVLRDTATRAVTLGRLARLKRAALAQTGASEMLVGDRAGLEASLGRALDSLWMAFQPIVDWPRREVHAYEALLRSAEPTLPTPGALLGAAERLGRLPDVGRAIRRQVASMLERFPKVPLVFVNLHPDDLRDDELTDPTAPLTPHASRIVMEITERASLDSVANARERVGALRKLGFRIAIDDLGAGYAGLSSFVILQPDLVKLDMALVRAVDSSDVKQRLIRSMVGLSGDLGISVVAEGIETAGEREVLVGLGCKLMQGYLFARPGPPLPPVAWQ